MRVICHSTAGNAIPQAQRHLNEVDATDYFPLRVGEEYAVYGLLIIKGRVDFLVAPGDPLWVPTYLLEVVNDRLPANWQLCLTLKKDNYRQLHEMFGISCIIGYPKLVNDYAHYCGILERDAPEMAVFFKERDRAEATANDDR